MISLTTCCQYIRCCCPIILVLSPTPPCRTSTSHRAVASTACRCVCWRPLSIWAGHLGACWRRRLVWVWLLQYDVVRSARQTRTAHDETCQATLDGSLVGRHCRATNVARSDEAGNTSVSHWTLRTRDLICVACMNSSSTNVVCFRRSSRSTGREKLKFASTIHDSYDNMLIEYTAGTTAECVSQANSRTDWKAECGQLNLVHVTNNKNNIYKRKTKPNN